MKELVIILLCYLNQPVALFMDNGVEATLTPFISAPLSDKGKEAAIGLCRDDEAETQEGFYIWHLDKINKHTLIKG